MKNTLTILTVLSFVGIAVFGVWAMAHGDGFGHGGCLAAVSKGLSCMENGFASFIFHANVFKSFSTLILNTIFTLLLFALALIILKTNFFALQNFALGFNTKFFPNSDFYSQELLSWLSLHENSPSLN